MMDKTKLIPPDYDKQFTNVWGPRRIWKKRATLDKTLRELVSNGEGLQIWGHLIYDAACRQIIKSRLKKPELHYSEATEWCRKCGYDITGSYEGRGVYRMWCYNKKCSRGSYRISRQTGNRI